MPRKPNLLKDHLSEDQRWAIAKITKEFEISVVSVYFWEQAPGKWQIAKRKVEKVYFLFPIEGKTRVLLDDEEGEIGPGEFLMLGEGRVHSAWKCDPKKELKQISMHCQVHHSFDESIAQMFKSAFHRLKQNREFVHSLKNLTSLFHHGGASQEYGEILIKNLLIESVMSGQKLVRTQNRLDPRIQKTMNTIHETYAAPLTIEVLAKEVELGRAQFDRLFNQSTGINAGEYIHEYRLKQSGRLLRTTFKSVKEICFASGFNNLSYFQRSFKNRYLCTPLQYRKEQWV